MHIPDKYFPMIRYVGLFSNRWKQQYLTEARSALNQPDPDYDTSVNNHMLENTPPLASWAKRQTDLTGIDPLVCPNCGKPLSFIGIFLGSWEDLQYIFNEAGKDYTIPSVLLRPG